VAQRVNKGLLTEMERLMITSTPTRLANIASRQRSSRVRDLMFAALVAFAAVISLSSVAVAADAAQIVQR
jgi:uncharacterized protein (DUF488 family)